MDHKDLTELLHKSPKEFVLSFLHELGGYSVSQVDKYRPYRLLDERNEVHGYAISIQDRTGGHEGDGEYMDIVFKIASTLDTVVAEKDFLYFRVTGVYNSWDSDEWDDDFAIVEQREVLVTQWFPK